MASASKEPDPLLKSNNAADLGMKKVCKKKTKAVQTTKTSSSSTPENPEETTKTTASKVERSFQEGRMKGPSKRTKKQNLHPKSSEENEEKENEPEKRGKKTEPKKVPASSKKFVGTTKLKPKQTHFSTSKEGEILVTNPKKASKPRPVKNIKKSTKTLPLQKVRTLKKTVPSTDEEENEAVLLASKKPTQKHKKRKAKVQTSEEEEQVQKKKKKSSSKKDKVLPAVQQPNQQYVPTGFYPAGIIPSYQMTTTDINYIAQVAQAATQQGCRVRCKAIDIKIPQNKTTE